MRKLRVLLVFSVLVLFPGVLIAEEPECYLYAPAKQKKCVYTESVEIGFAAFSSGATAAHFTVSFNSLFFRGVERVRTAQGFEFRKASRAITEYPDAITVIVEPAMSPTWHSTLAASPELKPYHVEVRWLDSSHRVIDSKSGELREVVEPWPELRQPRIWYIAELSGIKQSVTTDVEVVVTGDSEARVSTVRGRLFYPLIPAAAQRSNSSP